MIILRAVQHFCVALCSAVKGIAAVFVQRDYRCTGTVPEQDAGVPVSKIGNAAQHFACHHQSVFLFRHAAQQRTGGVYCVEESGAGCTDVKGKHRFRQSQFLLQHARLRRNDIVRRNGGTDNYADFFFRDASHFQCLFCGFHTQRKIRFLVRKMPVGNAGAGADPFVVGFYDRCHVIVGNLPFRHAAAGAADANADILCDFHMGVPRFHVVAVLSIPFLRNRIHLFPQKPALPF